MASNSSPPPLFSSPLTPYNCLSIIEGLVESIGGYLLGAIQSRRTVKLHFDVIASTSEKQKTARNVTRAKISYQRAGTDESLMDRDAINYNAYAFEAEIGVYFA